MTDDRVRENESIDTDHWNPVARANHDPAAGEIVADIALAIAEAAGTDPANTTELEPLSETIDVAALQDLLVRSPGSSETESGLFLTFRYGEYRVAVQEDGRITVYERR